MLPIPVQAEALSRARVSGQDSALTLTSWYCSEDRSRCYYTGHHQGFCNFVYWDSARNISVAFVSNNTLAPPLQTWLPRALVALAEGRTPDVRPARSTQLNAQVDFGAAAGRYQLPTGADVTITAESGALFMQTGQGIRLQLYPVGHEMLYCPGSDQYLSFEGVEGGAYITVHLTSLFATEVARRRPRP